YESDWALDRAALDRLDALGWQSPIPASFFEPEQIVMKAEGPLNAVAMGVGETHRVMLNVYVTFLRLTQGSLEVQHIKGPVGIAHIGTLIADRGLIWMLFFLGLISVNLAVVNFLPLPIVDGGQFLMLLYEQIRGKPVPIPVQNAVMTAGLLLIASVFLVVTFNDIRALLGG
ncbi:MAG: site-2 protease family protein, partial [Phycisphaerales bacterium]|nr:site-2 protease family protein [Phycisphaerales bacterium]